MLIKITEFETLAKTEVSKMKSNKRIFEENNKDMRDKVTNMNYNSKTTMQSGSKKGIPVAEKNANLAKNELKESQSKGDKNNNLNVN